MAGYSPLTRAEEFYDDNGETIHENNNVSSEVAATEESKDDSQEKISNENTRTSVELLPLVFILVVLTIYSCSTHLSSPLIQQFIYKSFAEQIIGNSSGNTVKRPCFNNSGTNDTGVKQVQALTSEMMFHMFLYNFSLSILLTVILGALSPVISRRVLLLIPVLGTLVRCITVALVVTLHLDIRWFYLAEVADGLLGSNNCFHFAAHVYISDITPRNRKRTLAITVLQTVKGILFAFLSIISSKLIEKTGFIVPSMTSIGTTILCIIAIFFLPERKPPIPFSDTTDQDGRLKQFRHKLLAPFSGPKDKRFRWIIVLACIAFFFCVTAEDGTKHVRELYLMNEPFCWNLVKVGWFFFARSISFHLSSVLILSIFAKKLPGVILGIPASVAVIGAWFLFAFAKTSKELYATLGLTVVMNLPVCLIVGETSWLLGPQAQGAWFAIITLLRCVGSDASSFSLLFYKSTLSLWPGTIFIMCAFLMALVAILLGIYQVLWRRHMTELAYKKLSTRETLNVNNTEN